MKSLIPILSILLVLLCSCERWVDFGEEPKEVRGATVEAITADPHEFANDTVLVEGVLGRSHGRLSLDKDECSVLILPVGFDLPDSSMGDRAFVEGMVFYHEELQMPGIAADFIAVRFR